MAADSEHADRETDADDSAASLTDRETTFEAIVQAGDLAWFVDQLTPLVDETRIHVDADGWHVQATDPAQVGAVQTDLPVEQFEYYDLAGDDETLGLTLGRLDALVGFADSDDMPINLALDAETRKLHVQVGTLEYSLALIDPDTIRDDAEVPDLELPAQVTVEGRDVDRAVTAADMVSDHVALGVDPAGGDDEAVFYAAADGDTDDARLELAPSECVAFEAADAHSLFSVNYLDDMLGAIPADAEVELELGEEFPLLMHVTHGDAPGETAFLLAPRIQSD